MTDSGTLPNVDAGPTQDAVRILQALDLPAEAIPLFLQHIGQFCHAHGGEKTYAELLTLVGKYQSANTRLQGFKSTKL